MLISVTIKCDDEAKGNTEDDNIDEDILRVLLLLDVSFITQKTHKYHVLLANMIDNALLHLYGRVSATSRYVPVVNRNEILVRYLKSKSKLASYKSIKHELNTMLRIARSKEGNFILAIK